MEGSVAIVPVDKPDPLNERERYAFNRHVEKRDSPISPHTAVKLFELFLAGRSCEDIRRLNPQFTLGQIVHARIEHEWDRQLEEHLEGLYRNASSRLQQVQVETAVTLANILAAKNRIYQDRVLKFIQSGDEEHLRDLGLAGLDGYRKLIEALQKLTGQEGVRTVKAEVVHRGEISTDRPATSKQAEAIVDALLEEAVEGKP